MVAEVVMRFLAVVVAGSMAAAGITVNSAMLLYKSETDCVFIALGIKESCPCAIDEQYVQFPQLFHLDEWETCLARPGALYCLGTFSIKPLSDPHPTYELIMEYSMDPHHFNRTQLHRGYCVSSRCSDVTGGSPSRRFQRCTSQQLQRFRLRAQLTELSYCRSHAQHKALSNISSSVDTPHRVFLYAIAAIVLLNVVGTVYDVNTKSDRKLRVVTSWSLVSNWQHLKSPFPAGDPRLDTLLPVEAFRVIMVVLVVFVHAGCLHNILYLQNPQYVEQMSHRPVMMLLQNGSSSIQMLLLLSSFFLADSLLQAPQPPSFILLPKLILKRIFRIAPVYILVMGFSATWWPLTRDGPMWPMLVGRESDICRRKFWPNVFFLQNFIQPELMCQWQTWFLAVDMQLYVVGCFVMLCVSRMRDRALQVLGSGFVCAVLLNLCRAYLNDWKSLMFDSMPNNIRNKFESTPSFSQYYTHPCGSLPAALLGLFVAHLLHHLRDTGFKPQEHKADGQSAAVTKNKGYLQHMFSWRGWFTLGGRLHSDDVPVVPGGGARHADGGTALPEALLCPHGLVLY
uniref:Acyltransferase 3 domain-containing protein n=1 Tax=Heliothis virescens TaxID=7102 RepID=A0A2A4K862_HELVI